MDFQIKKKTKNGNLPMPRRCYQHLQLTPKGVDECETGIALSHANSSKTITEVRTSKWQLQKQRFLCSLNSACVAKLDELGKFENYCFGSRSIPFFTIGFLVLMFLDNWLIGGCNLSRACVEWHKCQIALVADNWGKNTCFGSNCLKTANLRRLLQTYNSFKDILALTI